MSAKPLPPLSVLRLLLEYEPEKGHLIWRRRDSHAFEVFGITPTVRTVHSWNARHAHSYAGTKHSCGYYTVGIHGLKYKAHRLAWMLYYGVDPVNEVDHINGDPADNRICNLRVVSHSENQKSQKTPSNNTSGTIGICWNSNRRKWQADIYCGGRRKHLGLFVDLDKAIWARKAAERALGFHENHGRVSNA